MFFKFIKISLLITTCIFLSGFIQVAALLGPGVTIFSSGNVYRAGAQLLIDSEIKKKTGKNKNIRFSMQFLRHYCMDQVQRVSMISGRSHPFAINQF